MLGGQCCQEDLGAAMQAAHLEWISVSSLPSEAVRHWGIRMGFWLDSVPASRRPDLTV
jgi:hypothetical protein